MNAGKCKCGELLNRETVAATRTTRGGEFVRVDPQEQALVCPACGVIAFQPRPVVPKIGVRL